MFNLRTFLGLIDSFDRVETIHSSQITCKGLVFVQLYGVYEFAVRASVQAALSAIKEGRLSPSQLPHEILCLVLDPLWVAAAKAGRSRMWEKRQDLIAKVVSGDSLSDLQDTLFPSDGSHYRVKQLHTIWKIFAIPGPVVPDPRFQGRIHELVENRNAIAHGRITAEEVGRRYTRRDLDLRADDTEVIATYVVETLNDYYGPDKFPAPTKRE